MSCKGVYHTPLNTEGPDLDPTVDPVNAVIADTNGGTRGVKFNLLRHATILSVLNFDP